MDHLLPNEIRVLAIDPSPFGIGFAVLEGPEKLLDWGVRKSGEDKNADCLKFVAELIERYHPHMLALEDCDAESSRRHARVRELLEEIQKLARDKRVRVSSFSSIRVHKAFHPRKDVIAAAIAGRFPELGPRLPSPRACGDSEHSAMSVFDAAAFATTFFYFRNRKKLSLLRGALG